MSNAYLLTEPLIDLLCGSDAAAKGERLFLRGAVRDRSADLEKIHAVVTDDGDGVAVWFALDLSNFGGFVRNNKQLRRCVAAAMFAWLRDRDSFLPSVASAEGEKFFQHQNIRRLLADAFGAANVGDYLGALRDRQSRAPGPAKVARKDQTRQGVFVSSGHARWAVAAPLQIEALGLAAKLDAEFTTPQLRELARWLDVKLKGTAKSGYLDAVVEALDARVARAAADSSALLEGLSDEQADFARRIFTARDYQLPAPRALLQSIFRARAGLDIADRKLTELCESLRRYALLFPTLRPQQSSYRDIYYQWLPLGASKDNVPVLSWSAPRTRAISAGSARASRVFLDDFGAFLNGVIAAGVEARAAQTSHPKSASTSWLLGWEHDAAEADRLLTARSGWAADPNSAIKIVLRSPLAREAEIMLERQTGLDPAQSEWMFAIAAALQLVEAPDDGQAAAGANVTRLPDHPVRLRARGLAVEEWLALPNHERLARAWDAWLNRALFNPELHRASAGPPQTAGAESGVTRFRVMRRLGARGFGPAEFAAEGCALRRYVVRVLRGLPAGEWLDWAALQRALFEFYPECAWQLFGRDAWWFAHRANDTRFSPASRADWDQTVAAVIERIVRDSLAGFGAVEVALDREDKLDAFRITPAGQWLLNPRRDARGELPATASPRPTEVEPIVWLDDSQWRLPPAPERAAFIAFSREVADNGDSPFTYRLTNDSIERALKHGLLVEEIEARFEAVGASMPAVAAERLRALAVRHGMVRVYDGVTVLQLNDDLALRELLASTSLAAHMVYQISPRCAIVHDEAVNALVAEMEAKGYTPTVHAGPPLAPGAKEAAA